MYTRGISLPEIIIVIAIISIIATIVTASFSGLRNTQILGSAVETVKAIIADARSKTLSSKDDSPYGVHFATSSVTIFKGILYTDGAPDNLVTTLHENVSMTDVTLAGGGSDLVFSRLTGEVAAYGSVTLDIISGSTTARTISVSPAGVISDE